MYVGLSKINRLIYYETSYQNQFPGYWLQPNDVGVQNVLILDESANNDTATETVTDQVQDNENVCSNSFVHTHEF